MGLIIFLLKIITAIATVGGLIQGYVALKQMISNHIPKGQKKKQLFILLWFLIAVISLYGAYNPSLLATPSSSYTPKPSATSTLVVASSIPATPSTSNMMAQPTLQPTETPTMQPTPTDTPSPVPTLPPTPGPATKAATLPFVMDCKCSNNPIQVRVTGVHIHQSLGTMSWDLTLLNVGTNQLDPSFAWIKLELNGQDAYAQGGAVNNNISLAPYGQSGDSAPSTILFTFVPQQGTYTLMASMHLCSTICDYVVYNGQPFTFQ